MARQFWEDWGRKGGGESCKDSKVFNNNVIFKKGFNWNLLGDKPADLKDKIKNISLMHMWLREWMLREFIIFLSHLLPSAFSKARGLTDC